MFVASSSGSAYGSSALGGGGGGAFGGFSGAMGLGGKALGAAGSIMSGRAQARAYEQQAKAKRTEAKEVKVQGLWEQIRMNEDARRLRSTQRMLFGQAGVTLEGAPENLIRRTRSEFVQERLMHTRNTMAEYRGLMTESDQLEHAASSARRQGVIGAFTSFF
jgi:hypothetical protein